MVAYKDGSAIRLISRAGKERSRRFSELAAAIRALPPAPLILDGEVAIFDGKLISRFEWFRKRPEDVASTRPRSRAESGPVNGLEVWAQAIAAGYEGIVATDESSPYKRGAHVVLVEG